MVKKLDTYYEAIANGYNNLHIEEQLNKLEVVKQLLITDSDITLNSNMVLVDIGCGSGISTSVLPCPRAGLDPTLALLKKADHQRYYDTVHKSGTKKPQLTIKKKKTVITTQHLGYIQGISEALPFRDNSCDIIISITAVHNFKNIELGIKEIKRIVKARAVITILKSSKKFDKIIDLIKSDFIIIKTAEDNYDYFFYLKPLV